MVSPNRDTGQYVEARTHEPTLTADIRMNPFIYSTFSISADIWCAARVARQPTQNSEWDIIFHNNETKHVTMNSSSFMRFLWRLSGHHVGLSVDNVGSCRLVSGSVGRQRLASLRLKTQQYISNKCGFSYLRTLTTWHCPHSPAAAAAIDRYLLPAAGSAANLQTARAVPITAI